ncbi:hypothetical protein ACFTAO_14295 [Paenibacillus rhizoplanae]
MNSVTFSPGDRILLKAGSVWNDQYLDLKGSGSKGNPITVDRYGSGAKPLIHFGNTAVGGEGFGVRLRNVSYWEINNLEITSGQQPTDMRRNGVLVVGGMEQVRGTSGIFISGISTSTISSAQTAAQAASTSMREVPIPHRRVPGKIF